MVHRTSFVFAVSLALALVGCRSESAKKSPPSESESESKPEGIVPPPDPGHPIAKAPDGPPPPASAGNSMVGAEAVAAALRERDLDHWYGMYMGKKKLGYAHLEQRPSRTGEPGGYAVLLDLVMVADGAENRFRAARYYSGEAPYRLVQVDMYEKSGGAVRERRYLATPGGISALGTVDGAARPPRNLPATQECLSGFLAQFADPEVVTPGQSAVLADFDTDMEADRAMQVLVTEVRSETVSGVPTKVAVLSSASAGDQSVVETRIASGGVALKVSLGGVMLKLEEEAIARSQVEGFDVVEDAVPITASLGNPAAATELRLWLSLPAGFALPDGPNQRVERHAADGRLEVVIQSIPGAEATAEERAEALAATHDVDFEDPAIAATATEITRGTTQDADKVARLIAWVYDNLDKTLTSNVSTATQVLARKRGDCTEHALLFVALARAQKIPARRLSGLVYMGDDLHRFGWHEWAEVVLDGHWVQVDPSWNERVANPTHIKMSAGQRSDAVMAMGATAIEVISVK